MEKAHLEDLKGRVPCSAVLEQMGFALDLKESTRKAIKFRRAGEIIIVIHDGKGWFDPLGDGKGDVFSLVKHLQGVRFVEAVHEVAGLVGFVPSEPVWKRGSNDCAPDLSIPERWSSRRKPWRGSETWRYLRHARDLPERIIRMAISTDVLREGPHGSMWAAHTAIDGVVTGWEERGPDWRGYASGGNKVLFRLGQGNVPRICVTEAAIDAMSLAAIEGFRTDTLYLSTGGGWSPRTAAALGTLAARTGTHLIAATDNNEQGEIYAGRLHAIAAETGCSSERLHPLAEDWNAQLELREEAIGKVEEGTLLPHARRPPQG